MARPGGRYVPAQAVLTSAVAASRRGAFMSLVSCTRVLCTGVAAMVAGRMVVLSEGGLDGVSKPGWIAVLVSLMSIWLIRRVRPVRDEG